MGTRREGPGPAGGEGAPPRTQEMMGADHRLAGLPRGRICGVEVPIATTPRARLLGLALLEREDAGPGLLIPRCRSVHTFGMRFELDLLFLDGRGVAIEARRSLPPGRLARCSRASAVLELPSPWPQPCSSSPRRRDFAGFCASRPPKPTKTQVR